MLRFRSVNYQHSLIYPKVISMSADRPFCARVGNKSRKNRCRLNFRDPIYELTIANRTPDLTPEERVALPILLLDIVLSDHLQKHTLQGGLLDCVFGKSSWIAKVRKRSARGRLAVGASNLVHHADTR
jgi:hypothetical protein